MVVVVFFIFSWVRFGFRGRVNGEFGVLGGIGFIL